jgi:DNA-binding transcriptional regulator YhcF (GntR family)
MLTIKLNSPVPIYEQLVIEITRLVYQKELNPGDELPTIRSLASQLEIANNTVARAYRELERQGLTVSNGRKGTFVSEQMPEANDDYQKIFKGPIIKLLQSGMDEKKIKLLFNRNLNEIFK